MDPWSNTATDTGNYPYLSFFLSFSIYLSLSLCLSLSHSLIISSFNKIQYSLDSSIHENRNKKPNKKNRPRIQQVQVARPHESHTVLLNVLRNSQDSFFSFLFFSFLLTVRGRPFDVRTHVERTRAYFFYHHQIRIQNIIKSTTTCILLPLLYYYHRRRR